MGYYINDKDLSDFGITIKSFSGFENLPKRKGKASYSWPDENGVEPILENAKYESRKLTLDCNITGSDILDAQSKMLNLFDSLNGQLILRIDYLERVFPCFFEDGATGKRESATVNGQQVYSLKLVFTDQDPTIKKEVAFVTNYAGEQLTDFNNENLYAIL